MPNGSNVVRKRGHVAVVATESLHGATVLAKLGSIGLRDAAAAAVRTVSDPVGIAVAIVSAAISREAHVSVA